MLKRLELVGFKSFADRTQFDFTHGITAIVGPNGSGKSNIVDAVRWILGEQSAKSLRGGEMADVIFNGSTSRRSLGMAEVTMTFDNRRRTLATDAEEVQITRRVYRDGEGEYLINQQPCRLRDIKELFLGSGAGGDAYCIIEQGRVDVLLQSSTKERRTILEEAAGISRFKAKKIETLRKLERVDQNLQRLRDIVDEVEKQLRSVKLQASKAQRYQEHHARLKELRVFLGLDEFRQLTEKLEAELAGLEQLRSELAARATQAESWETEMKRLEEAGARLDGAVHEREMFLANARQEIATEETTLSHEKTLSTELETERADLQRRMAELDARVGALAEAVSGAAAEMHGIEHQEQDQRRQASALEDELQAVGRRLSELHKQKQADLVEQMEQMRHKSKLENDVTFFKTQLGNLQRERQRLLTRTEQAAEHLAALDGDLQELTRTEESLQNRLGSARQTLADRRREQEQLRQRHDETARLVADLRAQRTGLAGRIAVLEGLERSHEGLGTGVREVLALRSQPDPGPWRTVLGMVADLLTVRREYAPLIDLALGERLQHFLVRDEALLAEALRQRSTPFSGRVSFIPLKAGGSRIEDRGSKVEDRGSHPDSPSSILHPPSSILHPPSSSLVAFAENVVTCEHPELAGLPAQLLGRTLIVLDLAAAQEIAARCDGYRLVTLEGELLEPDGTLTVGTHHAEAGILSRKSELRELRLQVSALDRRITEAERALTELRDRIAALEGQAVLLQKEIDVLAEQAADLRNRIGQYRQRREGLHEEMTVSRCEIGEIEREIQDLEASWQKARAETESAEKQVQALETRMAQADAELREREQQRQDRQQAATTAKVALAQVEERLVSLRAKHRQLETDLELRRQERQQGEQRLEAARHRLEESRNAIERASTALARWYEEKESAEQRLAELLQERDARRQERHLLAEKAQAARGEWQHHQEQAHARELETTDLRHRRDTLVERLREDYQLDLAALYQQAVSSGQWAVGSGQNGEPGASATGEERTANSEQETTDNGPSLSTQHSALSTSQAQEEITDLKRKIERLGSVNLEALQELAELETRAKTLQTQFDDLTAAKQSLEKIIQTINQDSRRLFTETFAAVRGHFQELFRKLFGGGMADIQLEDETDVLESGIEIVARPPGKELRSISLMSGGEKTLTAVALLLAIFRSKPSPFCILDEVDAALDEANIGRYTAVLREFLDRSQFIIISHSKKTMASADVLYGITMQESGVSKRVAVRFEDWPEDEPAAKAG